MKSIFLFGLGILALLTSCATYEAPAPQHTYTTDTQGSHKLTALSICHRTVNFFPSGEEVILLTPSNIEYYVDGRKVGGHYEKRKFETFMQLPPGEHRIVVRSVARGLFTAGFKSQNARWTYDFSLDEGQRGTLQITTDCMKNDGQGHSVEDISFDFQNVRSWKLVEHVE